MYVSDVSTRRSPCQHILPRSIPLDPSKFIPILQRPPVLSHSFPIRSSRCFCTSSRLNRTTILSPVTSVVVSTRSRCAAKARRARLVRKVVSFARVRSLAAGPNRRHKWSSCGSWLWAVSPSPGNSPSRLFLWGSSRVSRTAPRWSWIESTSLQERSRWSTGNSGARSRSWSSRTCGWQACSTSRSICSYRTSSRTRSKG